ncbi:hypothetical protein Tco_1557641 [Tanacetum coccineum]
MTKDSRNLIILRRPFMATARAMIDVFNKKITLRVCDDKVMIDMEQLMKKPSTKDDECYSIDNLDETINEETKENKGAKNISNEHLYSASANEIDEKKAMLKDLPSHLQYAYLHNNESFPIIVSSKLSKKEKRLLLHVLEKHKGAIAWEMSDIKRISPSFCTHKILMEDNFKPVIQPQSSCVNPIHVVPKKGGMTVVLNDNNELIP